MPLSENDDDDNNNIQEMFSSNRSGGKPQGSRYCGTPKPISASYNYFYDERDDTTSLRTFR